MAACCSSEVPQARNNPQYLHANSTSHTWIFSAFAELIDNAYDAQANEMLIDVIKASDENLTRCITFTDNGRSGMSSADLYNMLSFGYCSKSETSKLKPLGQYGNGFKSGSMRIGKDAIVFTKDVETMSVGFLSQTYLETISAETILLPIVSWNKKQTMRGMLQNSSYDSQSQNSQSQNSQSQTLIPMPNARNCLDIILEHSLWDTEEKLLREFSAITSRTGTRIVIYNLHCHSDGQLELDLDSDDTDIVNEERCLKEDNSHIKADYSPKYRRSLREYCSILFLTPKMKIILRSKRVATKLVIKTLSQREVDMYRPKWMQAKFGGLKITFGIGSTEDCGIMFYYHNRLIKGYVRVGCQKRPRGGGERVVGVIEVDKCRELELVHNKQDFKESPQLHTLMAKVGEKLTEYSEVKSHRASSTSRNNVDNWVQCEECNRWRRLPVSEPRPSEDDIWICSMNQDAKHNKCSDPEESMADLVEINTRTSAYAREKRNLKRKQSITKTTPQSATPKKLLLDNSSSGTKSRPQQSASTPCTAEIDDVSNANGSSTNCNGETSDRATRMARRQLGLQSPDDRASTSTSAPNSAAENALQELILINSDDEDNLGNEDSLSEQVDVKPNVTDLLQDVGADLLAHTSFAASRSQLENGNGCTARQPRCSNSSVRATCSSKDCSSVITIARSSACATSSTSNVVPSCPLSSVEPTADERRPTAVARMDESGDDKVPDSVSVDSDATEDESEVKPELQQLRALMASGVPLSCSPVDSVDCKPSTSRAAIEQDVTETLISGHVTSDDLARALDLAAVPGLQFQLSQGNDHLPSTSASLSIGPVSRRPDSLGANLWSQDLFDASSTPIAGTLSAVQNFASATSSLSTTTVRSTCDSSVQTDATAADDDDDLVELRRNVLCLLRILDPTVNEAVNTNDKTVDNLLSTTIHNLSAPDSGFTHH